MGLPVAHRPVERRQDGSVGQIRLGQPQRHGRPVAPRLGDPLQASCWRAVCCASSSRAWLNAALPESPLDPLQRLARLLAPAAAASAFASASERSARRWSTALSSRTRSSSRIGLAAFDAVADLLVDDGRPYLRPGRRSTDSRAMIRPTTGMVWVIGWTTTSSTTTPAARSCARAGGSEEQPGRDACRRGQAGHQSGRHGQGTASKRVWQPRPHDRTFSRIAGTGPHRVG